MNEVKKKKASLQSKKVTTFFALGGYGRCAPGCVIHTKTIGLLYRMRNHCYALHSNNDSLDIKKS